MNKWLCYLVVSGSLISVQGFAAKERVIRFQNHIRVGYDDNITLSEDAEDSAYITEVAQITGKFVFSSRTEAILYWQPEFKYRMDAEPNMVSYQDVYARLDHALSQRLFLKLSDRLRYQDRESQSQGVSTSNQNYLENDLKGALTFSLSELSKIRAGGGYRMRTWDDSAYGKDKGNDFDDMTLDASYERQVFGEKNTAMAGVNYGSLTYDGDRGGYDSMAFLVGIDKIFSSKMTAFGRLGIQAATVDGSDGKSNDTSSPYLQAGFDYAASARTSFNGALGYSMSNSENSIYNAQNQMNFGLGIRHDFTAKINVAATFSYYYSMYQSDFARYGTTLDDATDNFVSMALRGTYQINRNNFVELGYIISNRTTDSDLLTEYDRNRVELGWKLRL